MLRKKIAYHQLQVQLSSLEILVKAQEYKSLIPPESAISMARTGKELYEEFGGSQSLGLAKVIIDASPLTMKQIDQIINFFETYPFNKDNSGWFNYQKPSMDWIYWLLMGGDECYKWAKMVEQMQKANVTEVLPTM